MKNQTKQKGFTLVELLVVIAIIGILTAIGVPMYNGYQASAKVSATKQNFDAMKTFIAGEVTKCSAGLTPSLADPKAGTTIQCPTGLTAAAATTYFTAYGLATMKNPYDSTDNQAVNSTAAPSKNGQISIAAGTGTCTGIAIQATILDPTTNASAAYPTAAECISIQ